MKIRYLVNILLLLFVLNSYASANLLDDTIYTRLTSPMACTRWLSNQGAIGCSTSHDGVYGTFRNLPSLDDIRQYKPKNSHELVIIPAHLLNKANLNQLQKNHQVKGILLSMKSTIEVPYSEQSTLVSDYYGSIEGSPSQHVWNPNGNNFQHDEFKVPIWLLNPSDSSIITLAESQNSRKGARIKQFMYGWKDVSTCLRYQQCEPVGGHSTWAISPPPEKSSPEQLPKLVVSTSNIDSTSLFTEAAIGADTDMSGLIVQLAALATLQGYTAAKFNESNLYDTEYTQPQVDPKQYVKSILWTFFEGEHWGNVGSSRFLKDWKNFECEAWGDASQSSCERPYYPNIEFTKLNFDRIDSIIEAKQVGFRINKEKSTLYQWGSSILGNQISNIAASIENLTVTHSGNDIPPSTSTVFLSMHPSLTSRTVVLTDHGSQYTNPFFGSFLDTAQNVNIDQLTHVATLLARYLLSQVSDNTNIPDNFSVNPQIVQQISDCLLVNMYCPLARNFLDHSISTNNFLFPNHYPGPFFFNGYSPTSKFVNSFVTWLLRDKNDNVTTCAEDTDCANHAKQSSSTVTATPRCIAKRCISSSYVHFHDAYSTAIKRDFKNDKWIITDSKITLWAESYWDTPTFELIILGNSTKEGIFLFWAIVQTIFVFITIPIFRHRWNKWYNSV